MEDISRNVKVGDREIAIARFRGFKAQRVMREAAKIGRAYPDLAKRLGEFDQAYADDYAHRLSRPEAEMRFGDEARKISEEAWEQTGGVLPLKRLPNAWERLGAVWPEVMDVAEREVGSLLAIVSLTNEELKEADHADRVDEAIEDRRGELMHDGDVEDLMNLAIAGYEVARAQFAPLVAKAAPLLATLGLGMTTGVPEPTTSDTSPIPTPETEETEIEEESDSPTPPSSSQTRGSSSTDSEPPTDGTERQSSTAPPGAPSEPLPTG